MLLICCFRGQNLMTTFGAITSNADKDLFLVLELILVFPCLTCLKKNVFSLHFQHKKTTHYSYNNTNTNNNI